MGSNVLSGHLLIKFDSIHHTFYFICGCELARLEDSSSQSGIYSRPSFLPSFQPRECPSTQQPWTQAEASPAYLMHPFLFKKMAGMGDITHSGHPEKGPQACSHISRHRWQFATSTTITQTLQNSPLS